MQEFFENVNIIRPFLLDAAEKNQATSQKVQAMFRQKTKNSNFYSFLHADMKKPGEI